MHNNFYYNEICSDIQLVPTVVLNDEDVPRETETPVQWFNRIAQWTDVTLDLSILEHVKRCYILKATSVVLQ